MSRSNTKPGRIGGWDWLPVKEGAHHEPQSIFWCIHVVFTHPHMYAKLGNSPIPYHISMRWVLRWVIHAATSSLGRRRVISTALLRDRCFACSLAPSHSSCNAITNGRQLTIAIANSKNSTWNKMERDALSAFVSLNVYSLQSVFTSICLL